MTELMDIFMDEHNIKASKMNLNDLETIFRYLGYTSEHKYTPIILFLRDTPESIENLIDFIVEKDYEDWRENMAKNIFKAKAKTKEQEIDILEDEIVSLEKELEKIKQPILFRINIAIHKTIKQIYERFRIRLLGGKEKLYPKEN